MWCCLHVLLKGSMIPAAMWCSGGMLPSITIEYRDMQIEADALVGTASVPSLTQSTWGFIKVLSCSPWATSCFPEWPTFLPAISN